MWDLEIHKQTALWDTWDHRFKIMAAIKASGAPLDYVGETDDFAAYPFLVAPAYQLVDEALVAKWTRYVENGGHLVLTCRTGQKTKSGQLPERPWAGLIAPLVGAEVELFDCLLDGDRGVVRMGGKGHAWNRWADVLKPAAGTETLAVYADQFYAGKPAVTTRKLGRGTVTYIGADTIDGALERDVLRLVYERAGAEPESYPPGVYVEWRDGFFVAVNYSSRPFARPLSARRAGSSSDRIPSAPPTSSSGDDDGLALVEDGQRLDVGGVGEEIVDAHAGDIVGLEQPLEVPGQRRRIARQIEDTRHRILDEPPDDRRVDAPARRVEDDDVRLPLQDLRQPLLGRPLADGEIPDAVEGQVLLQEVDVPGLRLDAEHLPGVPREVHAERPQPAIEIGDDRFGERPGRRGHVLEYAARGCRRSSGRRTALRCGRSGRRPSPRRSPGRKAARPGTVCRRRSRRPRRRGRLRA